MDGKAIPHEVVRSTNIFFIVYMLIFASSIFLIAFDDFNLITNFTAVAATFNNIGPGLELVGPTGNFGMFSWFSKLILTFDMLAGRLEIFPLLLLFVRDTWRKVLITLVFYDVRVISSKIVFFFLLFMFTVFFLHLLDIIMFRKTMSLSYK